MTLKATFREHIGSSSLQESRRGSYRGQGAQAVGLWPARDSKLD